MIPVWGKKTEEKKQFVIVLTELLGIHHGQAHLYSDFFRAEADYLEGTHCAPQGEYQGEAVAVVETEGERVVSEQAVYFLKPLREEIEELLLFVKSNPDKKILIILAEHIAESSINEKYLSKRLPETAEIISIGWDKIDKLSLYEGVYDGYYQLDLLSPDYRQALMEVLFRYEQISPKDSRKFFKKRRGLKK